MFARSFNHLIDAATSLRIHWFSTVFGVITIGVAVTAFTASLIIGQAMTDVLGKRFQYLGRDTLTVTMTNDNGGASTFDSEAYRALVTTKEVALAAPIIEMPAHYSEVSVDGRKVVTQALATSSSYFSINSIPLKYGRGLVANDDIHATRTCVIGSKLADRLGLKRNPVGSYIQLGDANLRIVGVLASTMEPGKFVSLDYVVIVSIESAKSMGVTSTDIDRVLVTPSHESDVDGLKRAVTYALRLKSAAMGASHDERVKIETRAQLIQASKHAIGRQSFVISLVAALSLVVSGMGIMNVAYLGVTERITEIGLRRAIGASNTAIRNLFLTEALLLSFLGNALGIICAVVLSRPIAGLFGIYIAPDINGRWLEAVSALTVGITVAFSLAPAQRATAIEPITALRSD